MVDTMIIDNTNYMPKEHHSLIYSESLIELMTLIPRIYNQCNPLIRVIRDPDKSIYIEFQTQFSIIRFSILINSLVLFVTRISFFEIACDAINKS